MRRMRTDGKVAVELAGLVVDVAMLDIYIFDLRSVDIKQVANLAGI